MARPKLEKIEERLKCGKDFTLSRGDYLRLIGADIPQDALYTR